MSDLTLFDAYRESFVCWVDFPGGIYDFDADHDYHESCEWGWACPSCGRRVDDQPCPDHAPITPPGLRLVECQAEPRHWLFVHDREDYGHGCPWCWADRAAAELKPLKEAAERREHRWCWLWNPLKRMAMGLRVARAHSYSGWAGGCWHVGITWRWSR